MILTNIKSIYLVYSETDCYFSPYVAFYGNSQYIVQKGMSDDNFTIEKGESIFRIDPLMDKLEELISEASKYNSIRRIDIVNVLSIPIKFTISAGGVICKSNTQNIHHVSIILPFNIKRLKYGKVSISGDCLWIKSCKPDGREKSESQYRCGYSDSCNRVFRYINLNPHISTEQLIWMMNIPANRVTPRLTELLKAGRISVYETFINPDTGRKMSRWIAKD